MRRSVSLPTGPQPGSELQGQEHETPMDGMQLKSVAERSVSRPATMSFAETSCCSLVLLQSLRQCEPPSPRMLVRRPNLCTARNKWVTSMLPRFSTKTRGKAAEVTPPPHTIKAHGKYDLHIGPHVFSGITVYEVHYLDQHDGPGAQCMLLALRSIFIQRRHIQPYKQHSPHHHTPQRRIIR